MIETSRLHIYPLSKQELELYCQSPAKLAGLLDLSDENAVLDEEMQQIIKEQFLPKLIAGNVDSLFYTIWIASLKETKEVVASFCFHSEPIDGIVEIGYGTDLRHQSRGYMTEIVQAFCLWAKSRNDIDQLTVEVYDENRASVRVLEKSHFVLTKKEGGSSFYFLDVCCK